MTFRFDKVVLAWSISVVLFGAEIFASDLVLTVTNIKQPGTLFVTVYEDARAFVDDMVNTRAPVEKTGVHSVTRERTTNNVARLVIDVPDGIVAIAIFHDVNGNGAVDEGFLGIPKEQYGFANNARPLFRPPSYQASSIVIEGRTAHLIRLR